MSLPGYNSNLIRQAPVRVANYPDMQNPAEAALNLPPKSVGMDKLVINKIGVKDFIASNDFVPSVSGWKIDGAGNAELNNVTARGTIVVTGGSVPNEYVTGLADIVSNLQDQIDGQITSWFYAYVPTLINLPASGWTTDGLKNDHLGDLFYDTTTGYAYRFALSGTYQWIRITDSDVTLALQNAQNAQDTADSKIVTFYATSEPTATGTGDLWFDTNDSNKLYRWSGAAWVLVRDTGAAKADTGLDISGNVVTKVLPAVAVGTPGGAGLYLGSDYLGYHNGSTWQSYIDNSGRFYFQGDSNNYVQWNGSSLAVKGAITATSGTFTGTVNAAGGTFTGGVTIGESGSIRAGITEADPTILYDADIAYDDATYTYGGSTAEGFFLGWDNGFYKFTIGDPGGSRLQWDGSNLIVVPGVGSRVDGAYLNDLSVSGSKLAYLSVGSAHIQSAAIQTAHIENAAITNAKVDSLNASKITTGTLSASTSISVGDDSIKLEGGNRRIVVNDGTNDRVLIGNLS